MKILAIIPARYQSSRFPGKPLVDIKGKTMIRRVYEQVQKSMNIAQVIVATDDNRIVEECHANKMNVLMTALHHTNGTERCSEVLQSLKETYDIIINVQGDEPFISPKTLDDLIEVFVKNAETQIATLVEPLTIKEELFNPSIIKAVFDTNHRALYFSRNPIPFQRNVPEATWSEHYSYWKHIGIYAFRPEILKKLVTLPPSALETSESLEQLRWLENGYSIHINHTISNSKSIDTPEDLDYILNHFNEFIHE